MTILQFVGEHPITSVAIAAVVTLIVVAGFAAAWSDYLDRKHGELR